MTAKAPSNALRPGVPEEAQGPSQGRSVIDALTEEAHFYERKGDLAAAAWHLDAGLALAPRDAVLNRLRARNALALGQMDRAEFHARQALEEQPEDPDARITLARIASQTGRHAEAAALFDAVGSGGAGHRQGSLHAGRDLMAAGRPLEAMGAFSAILALDGADRDALRGLAEACEAVGGLHAALRHWRRLSAVAPDDTAAAEQVARLRAWLCPTPPPLAPLLDASLRDWRGSLSGTVDGEGMAPTPSLRLRSLDPAGAALRYAVVAPQQARPGDLPDYGLLLEPAAGGAELRFALDPRARVSLKQGVAMALEARAEDAAAPALEIGLRGAGVTRRIALLRLGTRPRLHPFTLRLDAAEAAALSNAAGLDLALTLPGAGAVTLRAPRLQAALAPPGAEPGGFEDPALNPQRFAPVSG